MTLGLTHKNIMEGLLKYCKVKWEDPNAEDWIKKTADSYGKCRLVLENNRYYIESPFKRVVQYYFDLKSLKPSYIGEVFQVGGSETTPENQVIAIEEENEGGYSDFEEDDYEENQKKDNNSQAKTANIVSTSK